MRTIRITGKGQIKLRPDMTKITLLLEGMYPEYEKALCRSSQDTELLRELLTKFGFERSDLKTLKFSVDTEYESYEEKKVYKRRFVGYMFHHMMKVEFESDNDRLGRVLYALANCPLRPKFNISYTVKDPEAAKNELLSRAVADAREKASVLTLAAGVMLKSIQSIDYSWGEIDFEVRPMNQMPMLENARIRPSGSYDMNIEPDDIEASDTVTILWEIDDRCNK